MEHDVVLHLCQRASGCGESRGRASDTACLASSPGRMRRTDVWISRLVTVGFLLYRASACERNDIYLQSK